MLGPPTPVSGCPLERLETQDGSTTRVFNNTLAGPLNLTLEGQRTVGSEAGALLLLVHSGSQRIVRMLFLYGKLQLIHEQLFIRLTDLLDSPRSRSETVSIEKRSQQLFVKLPSQNQSILASFEERKHFSLAVCMLEKSGFSIGSYGSEKA